MAKILTDTELRAHWAAGRELVLAPDTILTPAAQDFIREQGITVRTGETWQRMPVDRTKKGAAPYTDARTGAPLAQKGEEMTHLRADLLVPKTHPRIALRGKLDSLMADILELQLLAAEQGKERLTAELGELLAFTRAVLAAEVKDEPLAAVSLLGMGSEELRRVSQHPREHFGIEHPVPDYRMGRMCLALNRLRTRVRETELAAAQAFLGPDGANERGDLIEGLNRLSSAVYILFCRTLAEQGGTHELFQ